MSPNLWAVPRWPEILSQLILVGVLPQRQGGSEYAGYHYEKPENDPQVEGGYSKPDIGRLTCAINQRCSGPRSENQCGQENNG